MHNNIMAAGSKDRPPMLGPGRYSQWRSRFLWYIDTKPNGEGLRKSILSGPYVPSTVLLQAVAATKGNPAIQQHTTIETVLNMTLENKEHFLSEKEAIFLLLTGIGDDIYSTVDACKTANEMWIAIERLQQGESLNVQDVKTNLFWEFGKFTSRDGESMESYYSRFYKLMNELTRNNLQVTTMQVNVQFLQQLQPEWSRFVTVVKQSKEIDTISYHTLFDILKQYQNEVNDIRAERIAKSANPLALLAAAQPYSDNYYQAPKPQRSNATSSSTRPSASTRHKGKEIAKPVTPQSESVSEEDSDPEQAQRDKDMQKNLALLAKYFKRLYKPTNNNLRTSSNSRNKTEDTTPRQSGSATNGHCKGFGHYAKECRKPKRVKDYTYHKEKMMMCKQAEQGVPLQAEQADWLADTDEEIDEQELEAHYSFMAKIQENKQNELEKYIAFNDRTIDYDILQTKLNETLGLLARKDIDIKEGLKTKAYEILVVNQKHDELVKRSLLTKSQFEGQLKEKSKVISDLKSIQTIHMLAPKFSTYNGRPTFDNPMYLKKAQSKKPCLYEIPYDNSDHANRFAPDRENTMTLANESRSKLNKDYVKPYDYTRQNSLYEIFKAPSLEYLYQCGTQKKLENNIIKCLMLNYNACISKSKNVKTLAQKFSKQTESVNKEDLKAQMQDKNIAISELKKLIEKCKGKSVETQTKKPNVVPISASKPKRKTNKSVATPHKKIVASDTTIQKSKSYYKELYENTNQEWKWWIAKTCPSGYTWTQKPLRTKKIWMPKIRKDDVSTSISPTIDIVSRITNVLKISNSLGSNLSNVPSSSNSLADCTVHFGNDQFAPILGYGDLNQGNITIKWVYYVEGLNHNLFSVGQFYDADLEVAFRKSTCFVRDLQGNDLLTASPTQAWLWHRRLSHLNFDYITLLLKKDIVIGLPKLKYFKDQLCLSCEMSKEKRSSFKSKVVPSSKGRLNLLHMDLCGPMPVASINGKKYILVIVDDYSRYTWTLFL
ncbi:retrovirus-related pol polyprotein from transposon TNT 1-94 [Tanacetum coccineum]|uniref:Retrovirus-related pol polyprotein from transposon TNT 1-94 n=1 Tax=Tanacetum coccineum TaxID=301880 RepID=A0ABQ5IDH3_9ASTR